MQVFARYALRGNIRTFQVPRIVLTVLLVNTWKTMEVIGGYTSWSCLVPCVLLELPPTFLVQVGVPIVHPGSSAAHSAAHNARHAPQGMLSGRALHHASSAQAAMGQISDFITCVGCSAGYFSAMGSCWACPSGRYVAFGYSSECYECYAGTYASSSSAATDCLNCPAGRSSLAGSTSCTSCPRGRAAFGGSSTCETCTAGTFAAEGSESCSGCYGGYYSSAGSFQCTQCDSGKVSANSSSECSSCGEGTYAKCSAKLL